MAFTTSGLVALLQVGTFSFWRYTTTDPRATVASAGYFASTTTLRAGDLLLLQAPDAIALLPIRSGPALGPGVTLDGAVAPISATRAVAQRFGVAQAASAVMSAIILAPLAIGLQSVAVSAQVKGPVAQVMFTMLDRFGETVPSSQLAAVSNGTASTSFALPPAGQLYTIRAEDPTNPAVAARSAYFAPNSATGALLAATDAALLLEDGANRLAI